MTEEDTQNLNSEQTQEQAEEPTQSSPSGIRDLIERTFLVGVGAAVLTKERIQALVDEFVRRGHLTTEEGRDVVESLVERSKTEAQFAKKKVDTSLQGTYKDLGLATRRELEDIDLRLRQLEHRVSLLEEAADQQTSQAMNTDTPRS